MDTTKKILIASGFTTITAVTLYYKDKTQNKEKTYTYSEIRKNCNKDNGYWVTYKDSVYNITNFINSHPGGKDKILLAAGKGVEPYWNIYRQHLNNKPQIDSILKEIKIGTIKDYDPNKYSNFVDPYIYDPVRDSELIFHSIAPCNAEVPLKHIRNNWITPNNLWYIRNHNPVPVIDANKYELSIIDLKKESLKLNLNKIKTMPAKKITTTIQCGGNRRNQLNSVKKTMGTPWRFGAISTAEWTGVELRKLLIDNKDIEDGKIKHVLFEGFDGVKASIPIEKVMNPYGDVILAYEMNGEELPKDHGFPLRVIVPGYVGIRNIKWLKSITLSENEASGTWQQGISYKGFPHYIETVDDKLIDKIAPIQEMPVQSCITDVIYDKEKNTFNINGFAWSGGGRGIIRVDISIDGGKTWQMAILKEGNNQPHNMAWAWTFWNLELNIPDKLKNKEIKIICKATDESYNVQPKELESVWNVRGLINNSWDFATTELNNFIY